MTPHRRQVRAVAAAAVVFVITLLSLTAVNRTPSPPARAAEGSAAPRSAAQKIPALERAIRAEPGRTAAYALLGEAYLQRTRETGEPRYQARAHRVLRRAIRLDPRDAAALTTLAALEASRHDFRAALRNGRRAMRLAPGVARPYGAVVDALVELGRYEQAARTLQRMLDLKPNLSSYARASYFRELHGDFRGALEAMELAVSAGGEAAEQVAYVQTLLGDLQLNRGANGEARAAYRLALSRLPGYVDARFGLARAQAQSGDLRAAHRLLLSVVAIRPDADHLQLLAEVELRLGRRAAARRHLIRARATEARALSAGGQPDAGMVTLEASYGDPARAVELGRRVWSAAPSVSSADALGWALTRAGRPLAGLKLARKALRLGTANAGFWYHAGVAALRVGRSGQARSYLTQALRINPAFSPVEAPRARRALRGLGAL